MAKHAATSLQNAQTRALLALLNLNNTQDTHQSPLAQSAAPVWKILVLDQQTKDVLATVLRVQDLRDVGVTLHVYAPLALALLLLIHVSQSTALP